MRQIEVYRYNVGQWFLPYFINGDPADLTDEEIAQADQFVKSLGNYSHFGDYDEEAGFGLDEVSGLYGDVVGLDVVYMDGDA